MPNAHPIARRFDSRGYDLCVTDLESLTAGDFEPLVSERFRFATEATTVSTKGNTTRRPRRSRSS